MKSLNIWDCDIENTPPPHKKESVSLRGYAACNGGEPPTPICLIIFVSLPNVRDRITE